MASSDGPSPVLLVRGILYDMARVAPTVSALVERGDFSGQGGVALGSYVPGAVQLLSPVDLQCIKAAGVTSQISFFATAGTVYQIAVDGYGPAAGGILLVLQQ